MKFFRRRFNPRPLTLRRKSLYAAMAALPLLAIFTFGNRGLLKRIELEHQASTLRDGLYRERAVGDSLLAEKVKIERDTMAIERLARERYGMVRPGETIFKVDE